jgi:SAM-dependent methyltransferase
MLDICPSCGNPSKITIGTPKTNQISAEIINRDYQIVQCSSCQLYYVSPPIDFKDEEWSRLYNSEYFAAQSKWLLKQRKKELNERFNKAESILRNKEIKFLDIGAGEGKTLIEGFKRGWIVTGIDIVDNRIPEAKQDKIHFLKEKFLLAPLPENHYDFIFLDSVLEHVLNPVEYLKKIYTILKPGGIVYVGVPNEDCLFNDVRGSVFKLIGKKDLSAKIKPFDTPYHVIGFNYNSLPFIINKSQLKIHSIKNAGRKFEFLSSSPASKSFWINLLFLFPIEIIGKLLKRDVYFEVFLTK